MFGEEIQEHSILVGADEATNSRMFLDTLKDPGLMRLELRWDSNGGFENTNQNIKI